jgi:hypothetical protein
MTKKNILLAALLAALSAQAFANVETFDADADDKEVREFHISRFAGAPMGGFEFFYGGPSIRAGRTVKNAPYSAEAISENLQQLQDGNQIVRKNSTLHYRDSAGRTRMEVKDSSGAVKTITIHDGENTFILHPEKKTAMKVGVPRELARLASEKARERIAELRKEGKLPAEGKEREFVFKRVERINADEHKKVAEDVRVKVLSNVETRLGELNTRLAPIVVGAMGDAKFSRSSTTKDLGSKDFDGVKAEGKQRSYEIPAGEIGNQKPIVVSSETWYSSELQMTVYSKHSDPRSGERTYRLANLKRDEPAAALFTVPSDYTVTEALHKIERKLEEKKAEKK